MNHIDTNKKHPGIHQFASLLLSFDTLDAKKMLGQAEFNLIDPSAIPEDLSSIVNRPTGIINPKRFPSLYSEITPNRIPFLYYQARLQTVVYDNTTVALIYVGNSCEFFEDNFLFTLGPHENDVLGLDRKIRESLRRSVDEEHPNYQNPFVERAIGTIGAEYFHILQKIHES